MQRRIKYHTDEQDDGKKKQRNANYKRDSAGLEA